jgi:hypothetical protein
MSSNGRRDIRHNDTQNNGTQRNIEVIATLGITTINTVNMMNVVMLSFANKPIMQSVFMFSVVIPNVLTPSNVGAVTLALGDTSPVTIV